MSIPEQPAKQASEEARRLSIPPSRFRNERAAVAAHRMLRASFQRQARRRRRARSAAYQAPILEQERETRYRAVHFLRWVSSSFDLSHDSAASMLGLSSSTIEKWSQSWLANGLKAGERGRPYASLKPETRDAATALLNHVGPEASFLFLRETFPAASREALLDLHTEFRLEDQRDDRALDQYLRWTRPGTVWGMDFHGPFAPIDGIFPNIFLSKDLSSHALISGLPTETQTSIEVEGILSPLFSVNGRPLVIKTDNGSGFISKETRAFLEKQRVLLLLSPGYQPAYNGGAESGVGTLKAYAHYIARREGRPGAWSCDDIEQARVLANECARPFGIGGGSPREHFERRVEVSETEREVFLATYRSYEIMARKQRGVPERGGLDPWVQASIDREAITRALVALGFLVIQGRANCPPISFNFPAGITQ